MNIYPLHNKDLTLVGFSCFGHPDQWDFMNQCKKEFNQTPVRVIQVWERDTVKIERNSRRKVVNKTVIRERCNRNADGAKEITYGYLYG